LFYREIVNNQKIIITDGVPSSGKSLICNLISSLPKVDPWVLCHYVEHVIALNKLRVLNDNVSEYLIKTNHNVLYHDHLLLRNINFRKSDISSIQKNPKFRILKKRLNFDETKVLRENKNKVISHFCLHFASIAKKILFQTFKDKLVYIQVYRSPITFSMINRIANWSIQIENSKSRDGHIKFFDKNLKKNFPYFIKDRAKEYISANKYERAIMIIEKNFSLDKIDYRKYSKKYNSYELIVPFEKLIEDPKKYLQKIGSQVSSKVDKFTYESFRKNRVPRKNNLSKEKKETLKFLKNKIRSIYFNKLINLEKLYEKKIIQKF